MITIDVLVLLDVVGLEDRDKFEKHVKKEGFIKVENEDFVYTGNSTTTTFATKALQKSGFETASLVFLLNETPYPPYIYDKNTNDFELSEVK